MTDLWYALSQLLSICLFHPPGRAVLRSRRILTDALQAQPKFIRISANKSAHDSPVYAVSTPALLRGRAEPKILHIHSRGYRRTYADPPI